MLDYLEAHPRVGVQRRNLGHDSAILRGLSDPPAQQFIAVLVAQEIATLGIKHFQGQIGIDQDCWYVEAVNFQGLTTPAEAVQTHERRSNFARLGGLEAPGHESTDEREPAR